MNFCPQPERTPNLQGYQELMIQASRKCNDHQMMSYNCVFRTRAALQGNFGPQFALHYIMECWERLKQALAASLTDVSVG